MALQTIRRGQNNTVALSRPTSNNSGLAYPPIKNAERRVLLSMPLPEILGKTVVSAVLSPRVYGAWPAQTLTVAPLASSWSVDKANWNNQPDTRSGTASKATGALATGARTDIDITALVQQVANGLPHYGWRVTSSGEGRFYGFATVDSWVLTIETSDAPNEPTTLEPNGGVVGRQKFVISTDFTDLGGSTEQASLQVQVDPDKTAPYAFDSGEVATTVPELDLATTAYAGLADGATTSWRVRTKDTDGLWSPWSEWATVTRVVKPSLIVDAPTGGVLGDPTPLLQAHVSAGTIKTWAVMVTAGNDRTKILYRSGQQVGTSASFATTLPLKNTDGDVIFRDGGTYQVRFRVWDRLDRVQGGPDDPPHIEVWQTLVFSDDAATAAPTTLTATPSGGPPTTLSWTYAGTADGWVAERNDKKIARLDPDDVTVNAGVYSWVDTGSVPNTTNTWKIKAIVNGKQGLGRSTSAYATVTGLWLVSPLGSVVLAGADDNSTGIEGLSVKDRRATYRLPGRRDDVDIVGAFEGISGEVAGTVYVGANSYDTEAQVDAAVALLKAMKKQPSVPVQVVGATMSFPALLRDVSVTPHPGMLPGDRMHRVTFGCWQVGDFD